MWGLDLGIQHQQTQNMQKAPFHQNTNVLKFYKPVGFRSQACKIPKNTKDETDPNSSKLPYIAACNLMPEIVLIEGAK